MSEILAYSCAVLIGAILGLTGGGGSILTVPVLVYVLALNPVIAAAYSLFIVGVTSCFGSLLNYQKQLVDVRKAILFAIPSLTGVFLTRKFIVPALPKVFFTIGGVAFTRDLILMLLFAVVMVFAAMAMLRAKSKEEAVEVEIDKTTTVIKIFAIGILIGLIGAGGGFLIMPLLYILWRLPVRMAIGTSLLIITINSLIGFSGDIGHYPIDWMFLFKFSATAIVGIFMGNFLTRFFNDSALRKLFGIFVLIMALVIFTIEIARLAKI